MGGGGTTQQNLKNHTIFLRLPPPTFSWVGDEANLFLQCGEGRRADSSTARAGPAEANAVAQTRRRTRRGLWEAARAAAVARAAAAAAAGAPFLPSPRAWASARSLPGLLPLVVVDFSFPCSEPGSGEQLARRFRVLEL